MGSIQFPKTLAGWGRYCDCLQNIERFRIQQPEGSEQGQIKNEKILDEPSYATKAKGQSNMQAPTAQSIETPPPLKIQAKSPKKEQKHSGPLVLKKLGHQTIDQLSQFSQMPAVKDNIFDLVRLQEDEDIKNQHLDFVNPFPQVHEERIRASAPTTIQNYFLNNQKAVNTAYPKPQNASTKKYFLDQNDKEQYLNNGLT